LGRRPDITQAVEDTRSGPPRQRYEMAPRPGRRGGDQQPHNMPSEAAALVGVRGTS